MFLLWSLHAVADLAPPPEWIKPCTVAARCDETEEGRTCSESATAVDACAPLLEQGYSRRCSGDRDTDGSREVVLCRTRTEHVAPTAPADAPGTVIPSRRRRCATVAGGGGLAVLLALTSILLRRRHA